MMEECIFCSINERTDSLEDHNTHIMDTPHFYVVAGRGQICEGYIIICARKHIFNMALLRQEEWMELRLLKKDIVKMVKEIYHCNPVFFEHGDADCQNRGGSCISHAHIHVVPLTLTKAPEMLYKFHLYHFEEADEWKNFASTHSPYFYLELSNGHIYMLNEANLPCQFGRQLLVKEMELPVNWDWRAVSDEGKMKETIAQYISFISSHPQ